MLCAPALSFFTVGANVIHRGTEIFTCYSFQYATTTLTTLHIETCTRHISRFSTGCGVMNPLTLTVHVSYQFMKSQVTSTKVRKLQT